MTDRPLTLRMSVTHDKDGVAVLIVDADGKKCLKCRIPEAEFADGDPVEFVKRMARCINLHDELVAALRDYESEQSELAFHSGLKPDSRFTALLAKAK